MDILSLPPLNAKTYEQNLYGPTKHYEMDRAVSSASAPFLVIKSNRNPLPRSWPVTWISGGPVE